MPDQPAQASRHGSATAAIDGFRLVSASMTVRLLDDPHRASYEFRCHLESTDGHSARYWSYHLPSEASELSAVRAWDDEGDLDAHVLTGPKRASRLNVRLRGAHSGLHQYAFGFAYESSLRPVIVPGPPGAVIVTVSDTVAYTVPCAILEMTVVLPSEATLVASVPQCRDAEAGRFTRRLRALRPRESASFLVAYRRPALPSP
jgi:hypothetical protein